ncbi:MAG: DUF5671 domain-containing protein [Acidimicrobiia bacterium]
MFFGLISSLIPLAVLGAIVYAIVKSVSGRRDQGGADSAPGSVRRLFLFGSLYVAVHFAAWGLSGLLSELAISDGQIAEPLAMSLVSVPVVVLLGRWAWHTMADRPERGLALTAYVNAMLSTALVVLLVTSYRVATWLFTDAGYAPFALAALAIWAVVWMIHWAAWKHYESEISNLHIFFGSTAGLGMAAISGAIGLTYLLQWLLDAGTSLDITSYGRDDFLQPLIALTIGAVAFGWYWLGNGLPARRDPLWHGYVVLVGVLGGLISAVSGAGIAAFGILQWLWGDPDSSSAVRHFEDFSPAVAVLVIGGLVWAYHRLVVLADSSPVRTEVNRVYDYVVAAVGLVTAVVGSVLLLVAVQEALFPPTGGGRFDSSINTFLGAATSLLVGIPLWARAWGRAGRNARLEPQHEASSPSRRIYLFGVVGVAGIVAFGSLMTLLIAVFNALFEEDRGPLRDEVQVSVALLLTVGVVAGYHFVKMRAEGGLVQAPAPIKDVTLVTGDVAIASIVHDLTGARVRVMHRLDSNGGLLDPAAVAAAVEADDHEHLLVLTGPRGSVEVIPYES